MSDVPPPCVRTWPLKENLITVLRIGKRCVVNEVVDDNTIWWVAGGAEVYPDVFEDTEADCYESVGKVPDVELQDGLFPAMGVTPQRSEARLFFRPPAGGEAPEVRVVLPNNIAFRASRKGQVKTRSKSYTDDGNPVWQVRLLYALKTGRTEDRKDAIEEVPEYYFDDQTFGSMFQCMSEISDSESEFRKFLGNRLVDSAKRSGGLSDWVLWENVAREAAEYTQKRLEIAAGIRLPDNHEFFIRAVKEASSDKKGMPAQAHVRKKWKEYGGRGNWKNIRETLGFEWLPTESEWIKTWRPLLRSQGIVIL